MKLTVHYDSNEQLRVPFPRNIVVRPRRAYASSRIVPVVAVRKCLQKLGADYAVAGYESVSLVERKRGMNELHTNVWTRDYGRFMKSLDRLAASCRFPYLVLEKGIGDLYRDPDYYPGDVMAHLLRELHTRGIRFVAVGRCDSPRTRAQLGDFLLRLMLSHTDLLYR